MQPSIETSPQRPATSDRGSLAYMPGLDGVRGIAVVAVLLFHSGFDWAVGGWLGVSVFFTLSGYLITSRLIAEHQRSGKVAVFSFWERRIRRLLPASLLTLAFVAVANDHLIFDDQIESLRSELISALFYVANWHSYFSNEAYSDIFGAPSPVRHFWSLSIEEQFYMLFPIVFVLAVRFVRPKDVWKVFAALTLASLVTTLLITDVSRTYFGTDTRVLEILAGVLLAFWHSEHPRAERRRWVGWAAWPAWVIAVVAMTSVQSFDAAVGTWLLPAFALVSVVITLSSIAPTGLLSVIVEARPVTYIGRISYGIYLFHWPIYGLLTARRVGATGWKLFAVRAAVTLVAAAISYSLYEMPIRSRRLLTGSRTIAAAAVVSLAGVAVLALVTLRITSTANPALAAPVATAPASTAPATTDPTASLDSPTTSTVAVPARILVVGDSTAHSVAGGLSAWGGESGLAAITEFGIPGCGVVDLGLFRHQPGPGGEVQVECMAWPEVWAEAIAEFQPDMVAVFYGPMDTMDRDVDRDGNYESVGMPIHDAVYAESFEAKIDVLASAGVPILWARPPYVWADSPRGSGDRSLTTMPERVDSLTNILEDLTAADDRVTLFEYGRRIDGGDPEVDFALRPDGVHLGEEDAVQISRDWLLDSMLTAAG